MADLVPPMKPIVVKPAALRPWGVEWLGTVDTATGAAKAANAFSKRQGMAFGRDFDDQVAKRLSEFLGGLPICPGHATALHSAQPDCVELGPVRIVGGIRPQNYDVAYRPDGVRVCFDSKTLNDTSSIRKNWQNMVNDLATEAATVHTRFPYAIVGLMVILPGPALMRTQEADITRTLERLAMRKDVLDQDHLSETIAMVVWDPATGRISPDIPAPESILRIEKFSERLYPHYLERYKGLPPHD
jgi:hypothetical protein